MGAHLAGYDGTIRQLETALSSLVSDLMEANLYEDTLLVIMSDHGEGVGERSHVTGEPVYRHGQSIHEAVLHVPLILKPPCRAGGGTIDEPASVTRLWPVIRALADGQNMPSFVPEGKPVVASSVVDGTEYVAAYRREGGQLLKHVFTDGDYTFSERITSPHSPYQVKVEKTFTDVVGIIQPVELDKDDNVEVGAGVERRLKRLGYR